MYRLDTNGNQSFHTQVTSWIFSLFSKFLSATGIPVSESQADWVQRSRTHARPRPVFLGEFDLPPLNVLTWRLVFDPGGEDTCAGADSARNSLSGY